MCQLEEIVLSCKVKTDILHYCTFSKGFSYLCNKVGTEGTFLAKTVKEDPKIMAPVYNVPVGINKEYAQRVL